MRSITTVYGADCRDNPGNRVYPHNHIVEDETSLREAVVNDYVCATYKDSVRKNSNFIGSDCLAMDLDNDHTDESDRWVYPQDIANRFPGVEFAVHYSRNNMKEKNGKAARPKFHVLFPIPLVSDGDEYAAMKRRLREYYPLFDGQALDAARLFYGTDKPEVEIFSGDKTIVDFLASLPGESGEASEVTGPTMKAKKADDRPTATIAAGLTMKIKKGSIPAGERNSTMSAEAARIIKRFGDTDEAYREFLDQARRCSPLLDEKELENIWHSAQGFFHKKIEPKHNYVPPEQYNQLRLKPANYTDVDQAKVLAAEYRENLKYSKATGYLYYDGVCWAESDLKARSVAHELTRNQINEANKQRRMAEAEAGKEELCKLLKTKSPRDQLDKKYVCTLEKYEEACVYAKHALRYRDTKRVDAILTEAQPMLAIDPESLDADCYLLNTPKHTYDLRKGLEGVREHDPADLITKVTAVDPSDEGMDKWLDALNLFFSKDQTLMDYVQEMMGLAIIGEVKFEAMLIAYGGGRNGKSTLFNAIAHVLGTYSGSISAEALTVSCHRNVKPEIAEMRGKRFILASELEEGKRLNTATLKHLCSTDKITAEKKYRAPFEFIPSHTLVLQTNHLPKIGTLDAGTWRRICVIPFNAKIEGDGEIKNYADFLFHNAGGAILSWMIEGAKRIIQKGFKSDPPQTVTDAIKEYQKDNDWFDIFLEECCDIGRSFEVKSGALYKMYRKYCHDIGEYPRSTTDFYKTLDANGYERHKTCTGTMVRGLQIKSELIEAESNAGYNVTYP